MDEKRQNELICELLGLEGWVLLDKECIVMGPLGRMALFTRSHTNLHQMRAALIERGLGGAFTSRLEQAVEPEQDNDTEDESFYLLVLRYMQATPLQQVEAAIRALGKWEED